MIKEKKIFWENRDISNCFQAVVIKIFLIVQGAIVNNLILFSKLTSKHLKISTDLHIVL